MRAAKPAQRRWSGVRCVRAGTALMLLAVVVFNTSWIATRSPTAAVWPAPVQVGRPRPQQGEPAEARQAAPGAGKEQAGASQVEPVHITHVFSSFATSADSRLHAEHRLVQLSWRLAAARAAERRGIEVEFLDAVLPGDAEQSPAFARRHLLTHAVTDPHSGVQLPTIGEIFSVAADEGRGDIIVYTNADIAVVEGFYEQVWDLAQLNPSAPEVQLRVIRECFELLFACLEHPAQESKLTRPELCHMDVHEYFALHGGAPELLEHARRQIASMYVKNMTHVWARKERESSKKRSVVHAPQDEQLRAWHARAGGPEQYRTADLASIEVIMGFAPTHLPISLPTRPTAFTLTRIDLDVREIPSEPTEAALHRLLASAPAQPHPGNDCFVMPRKFVPKMVKRSRHPLSWRPWGMWIPRAFEWEFGDQGLAWRRFEGSPGAPFTFHVGVSGRVTDNWMQLARKNPLFVLKLAAEWNEASGGRFLKQFVDIPAACEDQRLFRHSAFCKRAPEDMRFCMGNVRFACWRHQYVHLRDPSMYALGCERMLKRAQERQRGQHMVEPFCSFCSGLLRAFGSSPAKVDAVGRTCVAGYQMTTCAGATCSFQALA